MRYRPLPPLKLLKSLFDYDLMTGELRWKINRRGTAKAGDIAGTISVFGYRIVMILDHPYRAVRVIWKLVTGCDPKTKEVDHKNGNRSDDRWMNLRLAERWQQTVNASGKNQTGHRGVVQRANGKFVACIRFDGKSIRLGTFDNVEQASRAYRSASKQFHKEWRTERR